MLATSSFAYSRWFKHSKHRRSFYVIYVNSGRLLLLRHAVSGLGFRPYNFCLAKARLARASHLTAGLSPHQVR